MARYEPKTGRRWGSIFGWIRNEIRARHGLPFTYHIFTPPLRQQQAKSAVQCLAKNREIEKVVEHRAGRYGRAGIYREIRPALRS